VVIDPFAGTCSSGVSALRSGSFFIGCDFEDDVQVCFANHWWLLWWVSWVACRSFTMHGLLQGIGTNWLDLQVKNGDQGSILKVTYELCVSTEVCVHNHCDFCINVRIGPG
jgi:hypothetical protein